LGFIFAAVTYFDNKHLAIVPEKTVAAEKRKVDVDGQGKMEARNVLILEENRKLWERPDHDGKPEIVQPTFFITHYKEVGSVFVIALLLVITITNVTVRGLWTVFVMVSIIMLAFIFAAARLWGTIFDWLDHLSIYINMAGYLLISTVLFILWFVNFIFLDRQTYLIFTPGQVRVRTEIGGEETVYDSAGMVVQKQRSDMFRHWILGFGSGDLIIKPVGVTHPIEFPNVLFVGSKVAKIETMIKEKVIMRAPQDKRPMA
jgi:hypothetical protein